MDFAAILNRTEENGNRLVVRDSGKLELYLKGQDVRHIGRVGVTEKSTVFYDKVVKESNRFRKTNSWGLNWAVLEVLPSEAVIRLRSELATYLITGGDARAKGDFLHFKTQGFERQFFVPIEAFSVSFFPSESKKHA
jgi:hypothetical protein